jgi:hypothetical protein
MATTATDLAWASRWRAVRPDAIYNAGFGLEGAWRDNADAWGYPLEDQESDVDQDGETLKGRTFSMVGLVVWHPDSGHEVVGWP